MQNKSIDKLYLKLMRSVEANIKKNITIEAVVDKVSATDNTIIIKSSTNDSIRAKCVSKNDISEIKVGNIIRIVGKLIYETTDSFMIHIDINYMYVVTETKSQDDIITTYNNVKKSLIKSQVREHIIHFHNVEQPNFIKNIGLIIMKNNDNLLNDFLNKFSEECVGNIHIYQISSDKLDHDIIKAFFAFKKYYQIDLVCLFLGNISVNDALRLSDKKLMGTIINRKQYPYFITYTPANLELTPLVCNISNRDFVSQDKIFEFINTNQSVFRTAMKDNIRECMNRMKKKLTDMKDNFNKMELVMSDVNMQDDKHEMSNEMNKLNTIRIALINRLKDYQINWYDIERQHSQKVLGLLYELVAKRRDNVRKDT
jgi:hypothetical protein